MTEFVDDKKKIFKPKIETVFVSEVIEDQKKGLHLKLEPICNPKATERCKIWFRSYFSLFQCENQSQKC